MRALLPVWLLATAAIAAPAVESDTARALQRAREAEAISAERAASLSSQADRSAAAVAHADEQAADLARELAEAEAGMREARTRAQEAIAAEKAQAVRVADTRAPLVGMTAALARIARRPPAVALASGASVSDAAHLTILIRHMRARIAAQNAALAEELIRRKALREDSIRAVAALEASRRLLDQRRLLLARSRLDLVERNAILADAAEQERERLRGLAEERASLGEALGESQRSQEVSARLAALPGPMLPPGAPSAPASRGAGAYALPRFGRVVAGTDERDHDGVRSRGLALATSPGLSVVAPAAGHVLYAGPFRNYGDIVILDHGHGWTSLIAGLSRASTDLGTDLLQGAAIGRSGRRLLIELRHDGRPVDIVAMADRLQR
ncbi:peptidoglycan DD-metalloendopeptidase family protein [Sphingomonas sp. AP4-R1]|uniref:murein hydrolase activator EnvC family protein n=1 Tax=Sphingomonas sp. AP4-R1 TaxID=2735134 RepID=UPI0014932E1B|nr:peptidoglycan DD-metalloendopeptidase family protein [Sphingomonas sp. AP4-R1]QJU57471.1 peptidoglycan DD-metalloendopeptidase family protein [Sphingomonas sp. AP4-R1]